MATTKTTKTAVKKVAKTTPSGSAPLYNLKGEKIDSIALPQDFFGVEVDNGLIARGLRVYLNNRRSAAAKVKDRGEVAGTTKKMYAQKGTGRARHSTAKAPIFVGGGSAHGPQGNQNFSRELNSQTRKLIIRSLLSKFAQTGRVVVVEDLQSIEPKTKVAWKLVDILEKDNQDLVKSKKIGIISEAKSSNVIRAFGNIPGLNLMAGNSLNALDLSQQNFLILSHQALASLK